MAVKVTFGFRAYQTGDRSFSWTFSRWLGGANDLSNSNDQTCQRLANALLLLLGNNVVMQSIRLSLFSQDGATGAMISSRQRNRLLVPSGTGTGLAIGGGTATVTSGFVDVAGAGGTGLVCDQPNSCVQCVYDGGAGGSGARNSDTHYMAGIPDLLISTGTGGTLYFANVTNWLPNFYALIQQLKNDNWSFLGTTRPPTGGIRTILAWATEVAAPNRLMFTVGGNYFSLGQKVRIRGIRMAVAKTARPVGAWRIAATSGPDSNNNYTYTLANAVGWNAAAIWTNGTAELITQSLWPYLGTGTPLRGCTRKRGGSYGAAHGRSRPRQRATA